MKLSVIFRDEAGYKAEYSVRLLDFCWAKALHKIDVPDWVDERYKEANRIFKSCEHARRGGAR